VKLRSWPEIGSDCDVSLAPYVPKVITRDDDVDDVPRFTVTVNFSKIFIYKKILCKVEQRLSSEINGQYPAQISLPSTEF
jgi:hypothetical protein